MQVLKISSSNKTMVASKAILILLLSASFSAHSDSFLRIKCDENDSGSEVFINERLVGNCPVDAPAPEGIVTLRAKKVEGDYERLYEKQLQVIEGVPQRIEIKLSAPQLTFVAKKRLEREEAAKQLSAAENGNIDAMKQIANYYEEGFGIEKSHAKALHWLAKVDQTVAQNLIQSANNGNIQAMESLIVLYENGKGVKKDASQAQSWREKANLAKEAEQKQREEQRIADLAQEKARLKREKLNKVSYLENLNDSFQMGKKWEQNNGPLSSTTTVPFTTIVGTLLDLMSTPTKATQIQAIENEAMLRPSTWGKPDSMIAKASQAYQYN
jgi:hypothetical protein